MKILKIIQIFFFIFLLNTGCEKKEQKVQIGGNFELTNHLGERTTNKSFDKKFMLVFFGFTNCPDFCPNTLNKISMMIDELSNQEKNNLAPLFITVDPERDNVEVLNKYLKNFHPKIVGLTGTVSQFDLVKKPLHFLQGFFISKYFEVPTKFFLYRHL